MYASISPVGLIISNSFEHTKSYSFFGTTAILGILGFNLEKIKSPASTFLPFETGTNCSTSLKLIVLFELTCNTLICFIDSETINPFRDVVTNSAISDSFFIAYPSRIPFVILSTVTNLSAA